MKPPPQIMKLVFAQLGARAAAAAGSRAKGSRGEPPSVTVHARAAPAAGRYVCIARPDFLELVVASAAKFDYRLTPASDDLRVACRRAAAAERRHPARRPARRRSPPPPPPRVAEGVCVGAHSAAVRARLCPDAPDHTSPPTLSLSPPPPHTNARGPAACRRSGAAWWC